MEKSLEKNQKKTIKILMNHAGCLSLLLTALFFLCFLLIFHPFFETIDDNAMSEISGGIRGEYSSYLVFINIIIGKVLCILMTVLPMIKWYVVFQYVVLFISFWSITYLLIKAFGNSRGIGIGCVILTIFGYECCVAVQFTKTAGVVVIAGVLLIYYTLKEQKQKIFVPVGMCLMLVGSMIRFSIFGMVMLAFIPIYLYEFIIERQDRWETIIFVEKNAAIFLIVLIAATGLMRFDAMMYSKDPAWREYKEYNVLRAGLIDYAFPDYETNYKLYSSLKISEQDLEYYKTGNFSDPECFSKDIMRTLLNEKEEETIDENFWKSFFEKFPLAFMSVGVFPAVLLASVFSIVQDKRKILLVLLETLTAILVYLYLFFKGRYLVNRVDVPFFMAITLAILLCAGYSKDYICTKGNWKIPLLTVTISVAIMSGTFYTNLSGYNVETKENKKKISEVMDLLNQNKENLYLATYQSLRTDIAWQIFDKIPVGGMSNVYKLSGWQTATPASMKVLSDYNITNPYRECIDRDNVYFVGSKKINQTLNYLQENYNPDARAVLRKDIYGEKFYQIKTTPLWVDTDNCAKLTEKIKYNIKATYEEGRIKLTGYAYKKNTDSFKQNSYLELVNENGEKSYYYVVQKENEQLEEQQNGKYSGLFKCVKKQDFSEEYTANLVLEVEGERYKIPLKVEMK